MVIVRRLALLSFLLFAIAAVGCGGDDDNNAARAPLTIDLTGDQEVPPVQTDGSGSATIAIDEAVMEITVDVAIDGIAADQIVAAHFHAAPAGENGAVVADLLGGALTTPAFSAVVTPADVVPDEVSGIATFDDLVREIRAGNIYVNVHTPSNPPGELRGQTG